MTARCHSTSPRAPAALLASRTRCSRLHGVGHLLPSEAPEELANVVGALVEWTSVWTSSTSSRSLSPYVAQLLRWLRVLQREHYEAGAMARFVGRWSTPQIAAVPKSKVRVAQHDVAVLTAPRDDFQGAPRHQQVRARPKPERGTRRPITLSHVMIFAFILALFVQNEGALVAVAALYGLLCPWGSRRADARVRWSGRVERRPSPSSRRSSRSPCRSSVWSRCDRGFRPRSWCGPCPRCST